MLDLDIAPDSKTRRDKAERIVAPALGVEGDARGDGWLRLVRLSRTMTLELMVELRRRAQEGAICVLARNPKESAAGGTGGRAKEGQCGRFVRQLLSRSMARPPH